ncbi:MAG: DNA repair exonuclease [Planctomycetaceae bacterium]
MKFLHAADVHLDAQLKGLELHPGAPVERIRNATRDAFIRLIDLAIEEEVDFVVIAGDLFDRADAAMESWSRAIVEFQRLNEADIPVYLIRGNHDSLTANLGARKLHWPRNVFEFPAGAATTFQLETLGVALHGQSFGSQAEARDLAEQYPSPVPGAYNIGLLHTSLTGSSRHDTYAPTSPEVLTLKGYDYWALGHVHGRATIREEPAIEFPGCTQGRHINEPGAKGCLLVTVENRVTRSIEFRPLDTVRWLACDVELQGEEDEQDVYALVRQRLRELQAEQPDRLLAIRMTLRGQCGLHRAWQAADVVESLCGNIRSFAAELQSVWIERIVIETRPPINLDQLRQSSDLLGELLRDIARLVNDPEADLTGFVEALKPVEAKAGTELPAAGIRLDDPELLRDWLRQAEGVIVAALAEGDDAI